jgi:predicted transcriptional regulator
MPRNRKEKLPYIKDRFISLHYAVLECQAFINLSPKAKASMLYLQQYWYNDRDTDMGVRELAKFLNTSIGTAAKALKELEDRKFVTVQKNSYRNIEKGINLPKSYKLNWMPFYYKPASLDFMTEDEKSNVKFMKFRYK